MKKQLFLLLCGFTALCTSCHKNNYVTTIPAPHFTYVKTEPKLGENNVAQEEPPHTADALKNEREGLALASTGADFTDYGNRVELPATAASKAADAKLVKELSISNEATVKKQTLKQRVLGKVLAKRIGKMQNGTQPKAGSTNLVALLSGIAGLLSIVLLLTSLGALSILLAAAAIIMGFVGKAQIRRTGERGVGWAITGIVSGILIFFLLLLAIVFIATLFGL